MITFACVLVRANVPFTDEYVRRLRSMVDRTLVDVRHRFVCLTDQPERVGGISRVQPIKIPPAGGRPGWWSKVHLFSPSVFELGEQVIYTDLDVAAITSLPTPPSKKLLIAEHEGNWKGRDGLKVVPKYNSSLMAFTATERLQKIFTEWSPAVADQMWGDQDWIASLFPDESVVERSRVPRLSAVAPWASSQEEVTRETVSRQFGSWMVLCKKPKNHEAVQSWPWFDKLWR